LGLFSWRTQKQKQKAPRPRQGAFLLPVQLAAQSKKLVKRP
jgi:hypothetical protein